MSRTSWPYVGTALGGAVSVAANVAHSLVPPGGAAGPDWSPEPGSVVLAVFWPAALFVAVEIIARTAWPAGRRWLVLRFAGLLPVALVAAVVSYRHLSGLLAHYGEDRLTAVLGPLAVDGLMVTASAALLAESSRRRSAPLLAAGDPVRDREDRTGDEPDRVSDEEPADDPLLPIARAIADELTEAGQPLSRTSLTTALRARGQGVSTTRATDLLRQVRAAA